MVVDYIFHYTKEKMDTSDQTTQILQELKHRIEESERQMYESLGMKIYKSEKGFTQEQLYEYAGREDRVATMTLRQGSETFNTYGDLLTGQFVYTQKERLALESDRTALNGVANIKAKELLSVNDTLKAKLLTDGIPTKDIVELLVSPTIEDSNTFPSTDLRKLKTLEIPFEARGEGKDIGWIYGWLYRQIADGTALTPEERAQYLAYKLILDPDHLTDEERKKIYNTNGAISNPEVAYFYLKWKEDAHQLTEKDRANLQTVFKCRIAHRFEVLDNELKSMGLSLNKLTQEHPEKAALLLSRAACFNEQRYNIVGKNLMYLSFDSFVHIYLRHVKELTVSNQFGERSKFQLAEKDLLPTMRKVLGALNEEYQTYKESHPDNRFFRKGSMAYYFNGDYYDIDILPDGQVGTFYKRKDRDLPL